VKLRNIIELENKGNMGNKGKYLYTILKISSKPENQD